MAQKAKLIIVTGIDAIDRRLKLLPDRIKKKVLRQAMRTGIKIVAEEMRAQAPVDSGLMKEQIKVRAARRSRTRIEIDAKISGHPGLYKTSATTNKTVFYPAIVEYGTRKQPPNPFGRRAFQSKGPEARQKTMRLILQGVIREVRALGGGP